MPLGREYTGCRCECLSGRECHVNKDPEAGLGYVDQEWFGGSGALATRELASDQARVGSRAGPQECPVSC